MNRIICDICGSEYSESADRCPICSYTRQGTEKIVVSSAQAVHEKVKGGRFSSKNVKKRRKAQQTAAQGGREKNPNKPLIIVIVLLLIAIAVVSLYIGVRFFRGRDAFTGSQTTAPTTLPTETTVPPTVPCAGIVLEAEVLDLEAVGEQRQLAFLLLPENTTDAVSYVSADPAVATVSETGLVTAVGSGQTAVTITCGEVTKECVIVCWFQEETTVPPETTLPPETTAPTEPPETTRATEATKATEPAVLKLDQSDVSCFTLGESFTLKVSKGSNSVSRSKVTWSTTDPKVATVENGVVTAVGPGTVTITASYNGEEAKCIVRCRFKDTSWTASASDVTLTVGESFRLSVTNNSGETADAIWTMSTDGVVSIDGRTITGRAPGTVTLTTTVDGVTMTCIVRVK